MNGDDIADGLELVQKNEGPCVNDNNLYIECDNLEEGTYIL